MRPDVTSVNVGISRQSCPHLGAPSLDIVQHGVVMLLDKLDGVGADRQVKWRFSLRCDFNKQAAESVRIALLGMVGGLRGGAKRSI
jgi:hypothetical protein